MTLCCCDWSDHCPAHPVAAHRSPRPMTRTHSLKSWVGLFEPIAAGRKLYDLRVLDREYRIGDLCRLSEYDPLTREYTGRAVWVEITYITSGSGQEGHQACAASPVALHPATGILGYRLVPEPTL